MLPKPRVPTTEPPDAAIGTVQGSVTEFGTGTPVADATVELVDDSTGQVVATTQSDQNGSYELTGPPGTYFLFAEKDRAFGEAQVTLTEGETITQNIEISEPMLQ